MCSIAHLLIQVARFSCATSVLLVRLHATTAPTETTTASPIPLAGLPLLFVDDTGVATRAGVVRSLHPARTAGDPVLAAEYPWEGDRVYIYGSVLRDAGSGMLRMWYQGRPQQENVEKQNRAPSLRGGDSVLVATSPDGLKWSRPELGLHAFDGSSANNLVFDLHSPSVLFDRFEADPARRYKMVGSLNRNYHAAFSADGLKWHSYPVNPILKGSDTITLSQDPRTGEYLAYHKLPAFVRGVARRSVWLSRSKDFQNWSPPQLVLAADEIDDEWASLPGERTEVYNMSVFPHAAGFIGLPALFRITKIVAKAGPGQSRVDGPIDVQLASSPDGLNWKRAWPRQAAIPRGAPGAFDAGVILGVSSTAVDAGSETWVYYTAINTGHGGPMPPKRISIGRAAWRLHGFASLDAGPEGGRVETVPLQLESPFLVVNADASQGELRLALHELDGRPIDGFRPEDSEPLKSDATRWVARWKQGPSLPSRPVRLSIAMKTCRLYSVSTSDNPPGN